VGGSSLVSMGKELVIGASGRTYAEVLGRAGQTQEWPSAPVVTV
jgi:hypothetical protein